jgi:small subunit ribosomal protein S20
MPHTSSAKKRLRQTMKRRGRNRASLKAVKKQIKKVEEMAAKSPGDQLLAEIKNAIKKLDKAAARRVIHPNQAARKKSQLDRLGKAKAGAAAK